MSRRVAPTSHSTGPSLYPSCGKKPSPLKTEVLGIGSKICTSLWVGMIAPLPWLSVGSQMLLFLVWKNTPIYDHWIKAHTTNFRTTFNLSRCWLPTDTITRSPLGYFIMLKAPHYMGDEAPFEYQWIHWAWQKEGGCRIISLARENVLWDTTTVNEAFSKFPLDVAEASYPVLMSVSGSMSHWPLHNGKVQM